MALGDDAQMTLALLKELLRERGYRVETVETDDAIEERVIRPDGTVALVARKPKPKP